MALCYAPFLHRIVHTDGSTGLCCAANRDLEVGKDYSDWNSKDYQDIRSHMMFQKRLPEVCKRCQTKDEVGQYPHKETFNRLYDRLDRPRLDIETGTALDVPISLDLRMNSLCNLSCRMCGPEASSQIQKEADKNPDLWPHWKDVKCEYKSFDATEIIENAGSIVDLKLLGGEPTVQPEAKAILKKLIEIGNTSIDLHITTNGTNINKEFYNMLSQFNGFVAVVFSIDGWGKTHEYIRGPAADFETIWNNLKKLSKLKNISYLSIQQTITIFNAFDWWKLYENNDVGCNIMSNVADWPQRYEIINMPPYWKKLATDLAEQNMSDTNRKKTKHILHLLSKPGDSNHLKGVLQYTDLMDSVRNQYAKDHCPITYEMLKDIE